MARGFQSLGRGGGPSRSVQVGVDASAAIAGRAIGRVKRSCFVMVSAADFWGRGLAAFFFSHAAWWLFSPAVLSSALRYDGASGRPLPLQQSHGLSPPLLGWRSGLGRA
ncbi:hypothetical protein LI328DRAFT_7067 [Trichoderma asperelloides]|nr:hypothetical protein LI328DRAFT_7067 [Trichoderma asperelloides]